ncbi:4Fe-4S binding protein [bacterium]|nr:4Fe-4S binding protein [bacterium]
MVLGRIKRLWWQITGAVLFNFPFVGHLTLPWLPVPVLNCYSCPLAQGACPIGTIQHFFVIGVLPFFAVGVVAIFGVTAGRFYCSHLCPFGFLQDLLGRLSRFKARMPRFVGYGKYAVLIIMVIILPPLVKEPFFCTLCPAGSLEAGIPIVTGAWLDSRSADAGIFGGSSGILAMIGWWFWFKIGILVLILAVAVFIKRPFCRAFCPLGALFGLFNRISLFFRHPGALHGDRPHYNLRTCPVHITDPRDVDSHNCIKCRECYTHPAHTD